MRIIECEQGTPEWYAARAGIPTSSKFDCILTPTGKASTQAKGYRLKLLAEWLIGHEPEGFQSDWMARGKEIEAEARAWWEMETGETVTQVGFCLHDDGRYGCSPDGLFADCGIEIKCPAPHTHVGYLLGGKLPNDYIPQVQGSMLVTGMAAWHFVSYHPDLPPLRVRVERDEQYIASLTDALDKFVADLEHDKQALLERGFNPMERAA